MTVEELLHKQGLVYVHRGRDVLIKCLNPEHEDSNPSLSIDKITGIFKCFSCNMKGNIFTYYGQKPNKLQVAKELLKRKIVEKRAENIGLLVPKGSIPYTGSWRNISSETYSRFGAFEYHESNFIGRITFPIKDIEGKIVAFIGRHTGDGIPRYNIQPPRARLPLFPFFAEPIGGRIILVEGIFDAINLHDKGLKNAMCCFGTNNVNEDKLRILSMSGIRGIDVFFDGDKAGQEGSENLIKMLDNLDIDHRNIYLEGTDPGALSLNQVTGLKRKLYEL